jgi:site-specific recombinase XerD
MNFIDMAKIKKSDVTNNRIEYIRTKTKESFSIPYSDSLKEIVKKLNNYHDAENEYLLPMLNKFHASVSSIKTRVQRVIKETNTDLVDIALKTNISTKLTTYCARHTFATVLKRGGVATEAIAELMGHNDLKTTKIYLDSLETDFLDNLILNNL